MARILQAEGRGLTMIFTPDQAGRRPGRRGPRLPRLRGGGRARRPRPGRPRAGPAGVPQRQDRRAGRHRRGRPRPGRLRRHPRDQLRLPGGPGHLHPPHRPHRPGRRHRRRGDVRGLGGHAALADHRQDARAWTCPSRRRPTTPRRTSSPTWTSRPASPAPCRRPSAPGPASAPRSRRTSVAAAGPARGDRSRPSVRRRTAPDPASPPRRSDVATPARARRGVTLRTVRRPVAAPGARTPCRRTRHRIHRHPGGRGGRGRRRFRRYGVRRYG